jgi:hypothetical protein
MECPACGARVVPGAAFCYGCRRRLAPAAWPAADPDANTPTSASSVSVAVARPGVITAMAVLDFMIGAILLVFSLVLTAPDDQKCPGVGALAGAGVLALVAGLTVVAGMGLLHLEEYGRRSQLGLVALCLPAVPVGTLIAILLWVYLRAKATRLIFSGRSRLSPAESAELAKPSQLRGLALTAVVIGLVLAGLVLILMGVGVVGGIVAALPAREASGWWA